VTSDRTNPAQITDRGLDVELVGTSRELHDIAGGIDQLHDDIAATTASVDDIDARVARLTGLAPTIAPREIEAARVQLQSRHVSAETADLAALLDPVEIDRIRRRYSGDHTVRARLDGIDVLVALSAGVAATVVDAIVTATPATSPVTNWLRSHAVDSDNWLADLAHVPYDAVNGTGIDGMSALTHRVQTLGHDPLLGLIVGTVDIMRGNLTGFAPGGGLRVINGRPAAAETWTAAIAVQVLHLLSDVATPAGLPLPGWTALGLIPKEHTGLSSAALARTMFVRGYDSWHFMAMAAPGATVELVCRGYWGIRQLMDPGFADVAGSADRVGDHPRYQALTAAATSVADAGNLAKFVVAGANPLTLNYALWMSLAKDGIDALGRRMSAPTPGMRNQLETETASLRYGWPA
jgi:hypothetical protein